MNALLVVTPQAVDARFTRACLLAELGRAEEAKSAYLELLAMDPTHFGALNNLGNLLYASGFKTAARTAYIQAVKEHSDNPKGHVNLANLLAANNEAELAREHFEHALRIDPDHIEAHRGLSYILTEKRDEERAMLHRQKAFKLQPLQTLPYFGEAAPMTILLLVSASGGAIPMLHHLDASIFLVSVLVAEFYDPASPPPPHQLLFNAIGDADLCRPALEVAAKITAMTKAPVINPPSRVLLTGRVQNTVRLANIDGVVTAKTFLLPRERLEDDDVAALLASLDISFPLLLRAPGYHTGRFFMRAENAQVFKEGLASLPGKELLLMQYLDARNPDGKTRKYRVMMLDGTLYPLHVAIAHDWKIHYFTAEMADNPEHRAEDATFLNNMPGVLGPRVMKTLHLICETLALEYAGIDFSLNAEGEILLFEANATMVVYPPDNDAKWDYRRSAVQRILDAIQRMLTKHAA